MPKADSIAPESVEQATASFTPKRAPEKSAAAEDGTPSFEDRVIQLKDYYDVHVHLCVSQGYTGGRGNDLGVWVQRIRERYQKCLKNPSLLGEESPGWTRTNLGPRKLSRHRIERLDVMGFK
jgi:hypothetical protein